MLPAGHAWWFGHDVWVARSWSGDIRSLEVTVSVGVTRRAVTDAPHDDAGTLETDISHA